jgi:hypothetical protein
VAVPAIWPSPPATMTRRSPSKAAKAAVYWVMTVSTATRALAEVTAAARPG